MSAEDEPLTIQNWMYRIGVPLILMTVCGFTIYDNLFIPSIAIAFITGCLMPSYIKFNKRLLNKFTGWKW